MELKMNQLQSDNIADIAQNLMKAQAEMHHAKLDAKNPHFKSDYATLESVIGATKSILNKHGIAVTQSVLENTLVTQLTSASGQWIRSFTPIINEKNTAQSFGSGMSYARRYGLAAICCIGQDDDDGNRASEPASATRTHAQAPVALAKKMEKAADYVMTFGKETKGKSLGELGGEKVSGMMSFVKNKAKPDFRDKQDVKEFLFWADAFLRSNPDHNELDHALAGNEPMHGDIKAPDWNDPIPTWEDQ